MRAPQIFVSCALSSVGGLLAIFSLAASPTSDAQRQATGFSPEAVEAVDGAPLQGVACLSAADCWAVGYSRYPGGGVLRTLVEHWDGTTWSILPSPPYGQLYSVTCNSTSDCWAVGPGVTTHWDGVAWSIVPSPVAPQNEVYGVTCVSPSDCWLVGRYYDAALGQYPALTEHWNGVYWSVVTSPNSNLPILDSVTCNSTSDCWSVGGDLIVHWDGLSWSQISVPNFQGLFHSVTCPASSLCWAVGGTFGSSSKIGKWNGNSWTVTAGTVGGDFLEAVTCVSGSDCWTVGSAGFGRPALIKHWNGALWSDVPAPSTTAGSVDSLYGISCVTTSDCWAVGQRLNSLAAPLVEHWDGVAWSVVATPPVFNSVVSRMTHGTAGVFDIDLRQLGGECRQGEVAGDYHIVFSFPDSLASAGKCATTAGSVVGSAIGPNANQYTVNLAGVPNAQRVTVTLEAVQDTRGNSGNISAGMDVLIGDSTGNGHVTASDVAQIKSRSGQAVTSQNFRSDLNADGTISASDLAIAKSNAGSGFP